MALIDADEGTTDREWLIVLELRVEGKSYPGKY